MSLEELEESIRKNVSWAQLPTHIKQILSNSPQDYDKHIVSFSLKNQLRYRGNLIRHVLRDERRYYERIVASSRERLMLFPYHLADMIVKGLRITPFSYYISVVEKLMQAEKSYDTLPNFTAADCLRLLGIGRNEYIELMNKSRSNKGRLFGKKNVLGLLPKVPCDIHMEPWWRVEVGLVLEDDVKFLSNDEIAVIDKLIDFGSQTAGELDHQVVLSLYKKGLIYIDVPVTAFDYIQVPPLQGFVMNRVLGDYFETLLYKIFVSIDEHISIGDLANILQVDTELVKQAVSLYCRLQFARKLNWETEQIRTKQHLSWNNLPLTQNAKKLEVTPLTLNLSNDLNLSQDLQSPQTDLSESPANNTLNRKGHRVAFLFDSTLTAFLMMGNLSPGLKKHAVTMFEVGKLCDESLDSFLLELEKVSVLDAEGEGEARRFFDHAVILRSTVLALRKLPGHGLDLVRLESLHSLDDATCLRLLQKKYRLLVSMAPLSREVRSVCTFSPPHLGPAVPEINSLWFKLFLYHMTGYGPPSLLLIKGTNLKKLPRMFLGYSRLLVTTWLHEPAVIPVANILHVNAALKYSCVLIQAYGVHHLAQTYILPFPFRPDTPSRNDNSGISEIDSQFKNHPAIRRLQEFVDLEHNCGYVTFANIGVLDFGCPDNSRDLNVTLLGRKFDNNVKVQKSQRSSIINENYNFSNREMNEEVVRIVQNEGKLESPVESHFAVTTNRSSPSNGFTSLECTELLQIELDALEKKTGNLQVNVENSVSMDLLSPTEENIDMFTRDNLEKKEESIPENNGEVWTLLDCHFGIPLFDVNANTKICDTIVFGGLADQDSLEKLVENSRNLSSLLLDFISQCQSFRGKHMEIMKRGRLIPIPKVNLVFDNGRLRDWPGK